MSRSKGKDAEETSNVSKRLSKPTESKTSSLQIKESFEPKPNLAPAFPSHQPITSSPTRTTPIANQLSLQRRHSGASKSNVISNEGVIPPSISITNDLSSVGLMVSSMTLHQRPGSRANISQSSAPNSKRNSRSTTPKRRR